MTQSRGIIWHFKHPRCKTIFKQGKNIETLQNNVARCGQLYIVAAQNRDGDLDEFLPHEMQSFPHSLSNFGKFHLPSTKSDMWRCLELPGQPEPPLTHDCKVVDGAVIVHCLSTSLSRAYFPCMQTRYSFLPGEQSAECHEVGC